MSLTSALNTSNSALRFNQNAISTVTKNVANANTVGYTRQVIVSESQVIGGVGQGVTPGAVVRYSDQIVQSGMDSQRANLSYNQTISKYFSTIESQFGKLSTDTSANLDSQISSMFSELNNLVEDPTSSSNRVTFKNSTQQTTSRINTLANDLKNTQIELDDQVTGDIEIVNQALKNISDLNKQIAQVERAGGNSSDLKDLRQNEINIVSSHMSIKTSEKELGVVHVSLDTGKVLVDNTYVKLTRTTGSPFGGIGYNRVLDDGQLSNTTQQLNSDDLEVGSLGALVDLRDSEIPNLLAQLDNFAVAFIEEFNNIHAQGSAVPPPASLESVSHINAGLSDLVNDLGLTAGTDFDLSIVDADGNSILSTANMPYVGSLNNSTIPGVSTATIDVDAYLAANGDNASIEGTSNVEYMGGGMYRLTDPSGGVHTASLNPNTFPVAAGAPAQLTFANGMSLNVDSGTAEPALGVVGSIDTKLDSGPIRIEQGDTLDDLAAKINSNSAINGEVTASVVSGALVLTSNNPDNGVVLGNDPTGNTFNRLGFNRYFEGTDAASMDVADRITSDLNNIATGRMNEDGSFTHTNNENAIELTKLQNETFSFGESGGLNSQDSTLTGYFVSITSGFAANVNANSSQQEFNQALFNDFDARVQSTSGVNTDEEFSNLIIYQSSFEAASRMIRVIDEMLDTLIKMA